MKKYSFLILAGFVFLISLAGCKRSPEDVAWNDVTEKNSIVAIDSFLLKYPSGKYTQEAKEHLDILYWEKAEQNPSVWNYKLYVSKNPTGKHLAEATMKMKDLPVEKFSPQEIAPKTYVGRIIVGNQFEQLVSLQLTEIQAKGDTLNFRANLNSANIREIVDGFVDSSTGTIQFAPIRDKDFRFIDTPGRLYRKNGSVQFESTDLKQYWILH